MHNNNNELLQIQWILINIYKYILPPRAHCGFLSMPSQGTSICHTVAPYDDQGCSTIFLATFWILRLYSDHSRHQPYH